LEFHETVLDNGLEIVAEVNPEAHSSAVGFFVKTGSRDEWDHVAGVSHFLEHMMFKGTPSRSAEDVNREFDEMGAHYNAFTSEENTVYYAAVLPEYLDNAVRLLGDILRPSLREEDFDTEKKVIIEEIRMYLDQPPFGADERVRRMHFGDHPLGRTVLGSVDSITALSVDDMRGYFEKRYSPTNIAVVAAGKMNFGEFVQTVSQVCGGWKPIAAGRTITPAAPHEGFLAMEKESATQAYSLSMSNAPSSTDPSRYAAKVLATVVGDDPGSRLYWELVDPGLAEQAALGHYDYAGTGLFLTWLACSPEDARDNLDRIRRIYEEVEANGITADELAQAKSKINSRIVLASERPRGRLFNVGANWIARREYRTIQGDLEAIESLSLEEVAAVLKQYPLTRATTVLVGPPAAESHAG
jgi:predicted Zn-dependent peptidase